MAQVKKIIDLGCAELIVLDDGRAINQHKEELTLVDAKIVATQLAEVADGIRETIYVRGGRIFKNMEVGSEVL